MFETRRSHDGGPEIYTSGAETPDRGPNLEEGETANRPSTGRMDLPTISEKEGGGAFGRKSYFGHEPDEEAEWTDGQ